MSTKISSLAGQFRGLRRDDPSTWPPAPKIAMLLTVFVALVSGGYFLDTKPALAKLAAAARKEESLKREYIDKYSQAMNLDLYKAQLVEVDRSFGALLKQLPDRAKMDALIRSVNQAGIGRGLVFDLFRPAPQEIKHDFYAELPISIKVQGSYHQIGLFAADVAKLPRVVTLNDVTVSVSKDGLLLMETAAKTFRYLDEDEVEAQRRAAAAKAKLQKAPSKAKTVKAAAPSSPKK